MEKLNCVLLIDDDEGTNYYHKIIIDGLGATKHVQICTDGQDALDYLTNKGKYVSNTTYPCPELIFLDINMPKMNGFEFLDEYKKISPKLRKDQIIIMVTTSLLDDDRDNALSYESVHDFVHKPLTEVFLKNLVEKYLNLFSHLNAS